VQFANEVLAARWNFRAGDTLSILANLSDQTKPLPNALLAGEAIWGDRPGERLAAWSVHAAIGAP
jgi:hypothetical protein